MKKLSFLIITAILINYGLYAQPQSTHWKGKKVAFLGDSMTQKKDSKYTVYWEYLAEFLGIDPFVYGISGRQWDERGIQDQAKKLKSEHGTDVDAIFIFAGTNDYNHNIPLGEFYSETEKEVNHYGNVVNRKYRTPIMTDSTFCGRINKTMAYLKANFPQQQIIILTPIHRAYATFSETNIQPSESYCNGEGLFLESYVNALKQAGTYWAVPVIDLHSLSGLYPLEDAHTQYFRSADTDRLHPNSEGNLRLAKTIQYQIMALPATFRD